MFKNISLETLGIKLGMRESLRLAALGNFEGMDIDISAASKLAAEHSPSYLKGMLDSFNIRAGAWRLPFCMDIPGAEFESALKTFETMLPLAVELGALRVLVSLPSGSDSVSFEDACCYLSEKLVSLANLLDKYGCAAGLEIPENQKGRKPYKHNYGFSFGQVISMCRKASISNAGIVFDTWLWHRAGGSMEQLREIKPEDIVYIKASDADTGGSSENPQDTGRRLPGETKTVDIPLVLKTLKERGCRGPVTPVTSDSKLTRLPYDIAVILSGGYLSDVWKKAMS